MANSNAVANSPEQQTASEKHRQPPILSAEWRHFSERKRTSPTRCVPFFNLLHINGTAKKIKKFSLKHPVPLSSLAKNVTFDSDQMWVELVDGRKLGVPLAFFPRLFNATSEQRESFIISGGGIGIHWDDLDEDISVKGL